MTRTCGSGNDGCTSGDNDDFSPQGYFYIVRVAAGAVNQPVTLQIYDPSWVETGDLCDGGPTSSSGTPPRDNMNAYTTTDGRTRYHATGGGESPNSFCTGDVRNGGNTPIVTSFGLRKPTDTYQPNQGTPITTCEKQYPGFLQEGNPGGKPDNVSTGTLAQMQADGADPSKPGTCTNTNYDDSPCAGVPPVGELLHLHTDRARRLLPPGPHQRGTRHPFTRRERWLHRQRQGVLPDRRRHLRRWQREQQVRAPGEVELDERVRSGVHLRLAEHVDLRQLLGGAAALQPRTGDPGSPDEDADHPLLRHR